MKPVTRARCKLCRRKFDIPMYVGIQPGQVRESGAPLMVAYACGWNDKRSDVVDITIEKCCPDCAKKIVRAVKRTIAKLARKPK